MTHTEFINAYQRWAIDRLNLMAMLENPEINYIAKHDAVMELEKRFDTLREHISQLHLDFNPILNEYSIPF